MCLDHHWASLRDDILLVSVIVYIPLCDEPRQILASGFTYRLNAYELSNLITRSSGSSDQDYQLYCAYGWEIETSRRDTCIYLHVEEMDQERTRCFTNYIYIENELKLYISYVLFFLYVLSSSAPTPPLSSFNEEHSPIDCSLWERVHYRECFHTKLTKHPHYTAVTLALLSGSKELLIKYLLIIILYGK